MSLRHKTESAWEEAMLLFSSHLIITDVPTVPVSPCPCVVSPSLISPPLITLNYSIRTGGGLTPTQEYIHHPAGEYAWEFILCLLVFNTRITLAKTFFLESGVNWSKTSKPLFCFPWPKGSMGRSKILGKARRKKNGFKRKAAPTGGWRTIFCWNYWHPRTLLRAL